MTTKRKRGAKLAVEPKRVGRPPLYTDELAEEFCRRIAEGRSEISVSKEAGMPSHATVWKWARENPAFSTMYAHAREVRAGALAERALAIAEGAMGMPSEGVAAARLEVDTLKWFASKLDPQRWAERTRSENTNLNVNVNARVPDADRASKELEALYHVAAIEGGDREGAASGDPGGKGARKPH